MASFSKKSIAFIKQNPRNDAFFTILEGSIRSSKTWTMIPKLVFGLIPYQVPGDRIIFGVSKETIYNNVLTQLFDFVGTKNYTYNRQSGELWLYDQRWSIVGAKDEGSEKYIRGRTVGIAYGDELVLIPKTFLDMMLGRMSPDGARIYGTTNPDSPYHYINQEYLLDEKKKSAGLVRSIHFDLDDNLSLTTAVRARYEAMYKGVFYDRMIKGRWVIADGAIYKDCLNDENIYDDDSRPPNLSVPGGYNEMFIPIDYGTGNPTVFLHIIDSKEIYWVDNEYYYDSNEIGIQKTDSQYVRDLKEFQVKHRAEGAQCIVDPSAASLKAEMIQNGVWHCDAENEVIDGIRSVSSLLAKKKIKIHKRCVKLLTELPTYAWDKRKQLIGEDAPLKQKDHAPDALRYFVQTKVPAWRIAA